MKVFEKKLILLSLICVILLSGCQAPPPSGEYLTPESVEFLLNSSDFVNKPLLQDIVLDKYSEEIFLFNNKCFAFYRDMDYYLLFSARYDFRDSIINEYPPQAVRTIDNNGQKSMYIVYETDNNTRVFVFFFETDDFLFTRGYPIIMKKTLHLSDFSAIKEGDTIRDVENVDPTAALYKDGYDTISDELMQKLYVRGKETISSVHLLKDGIVRINYVRETNGDYIIEKIIRSDDFSIPVLGGRLCYLIYPEDYMD